MKKMTVIYPAYFPSTHTLCQIAGADVVVWAESFLYKKHATINRMRIKSVAGAQWLTVPVLTKGKEQQKISKVLIDPNHHWKDNHLKSIEVSYQNSPYYFYLADELEKFINKEWSALNELLFESTLFLCQKMRLRPTFLKSSEMPPVKNRSERVVEWLKSSECDTYVIREEDEHLIDRPFVEKNNYRLEPKTFAPPPYHQLYGDFLDNVSGLDLLFNEGELSKSILQKNNM